MPPSATAGCRADVFALFLRVVRRYPFALVVLLVPVACLTYSLFDPFRAAALIPVPLMEKFSPPPVVAPPTQPPILLVSGYFPLSKSKHTQYQYYSWISRFLSRITTDVYLFTPPDMEPIIRELRGDLPIIINTTFSSAFDIPPFHGLQEAFVHQHTLDREAYKHNPELYAIWAAKPYFIHEACENTQTEYSYVFWVDAGSMREPHAFMHWPDLERVEAVWDEGALATGTPKEDLVLIPVEYAMPAEARNWTEADGAIDTQFSEGSLLGGSPRAMAWWLQLYMTYFQHYMHAGVFVGQDQTLMNALFLLAPARFITVWNRDPTAPAALLPVHAVEGALGRCGDPWFYYFFWLARGEEREAQNVLWAARWRWDFWTAHISAPCRLTRVLGMEALLRRTLGDDWAPPAATLRIDGALSR